MSDGKNILLKVTGSVAAFKAAALSSKLTQEGYTVRVVLSASAKEFVGASTFEGLTRQKVYDWTFAAGDAMAHIDLARWAALTLVYPASANTLTKLSQGRADDLVGTLFLAHDFKTPYWIVPAMNPSMFSHPAVVDAVERLKHWGVEVLDPDSGRMACGEVGAGRLIEPEALLSEVNAYFSSRPDGTLSSGHVLVTAGGTIEPIDPVRVLTNVSTGETGVKITNALARSGFSTTLLLSAHSPFLKSVSRGVRLRTFSTFNDLERLMQSELSSQKVDTLVHAAAVSDYRLERIQSENGAKIESDVKIQSDETISLVLKPNPKILHRVREYSVNPEMRVISFKLATHGGADLSGYSSDVIFYNTVSGIERDSERHAGEIYLKTPTGYQRKDIFQTKSELVSAMVRFCGKKETL